MTNRLLNKVAIITGGSKGIGKGIAKLYVAQGAKVVLNYASDNNAAQATAEEIRSQGGEAIVHKGDVSKRADMQEMAALTLATYGRIDILCANAGIYPKAAIEEMSEEEWDRVNDVNYKGTFLAVQACLPQMIAQRYGKIVVISSTTGSLPVCRSKCTMAQARRGRLALCAAHRCRWQSTTSRSTLSCLGLSIPKALNRI